MNRLLWVGVFFAWSLATYAQAQTQLETDQQTLKRLNMPTDAKGLIKFFEKGSLKEGDAKKLEALVRKLGSAVYAIREPAKRELSDFGPVALPFLRGALVDTKSDVEAKRRAKLCIDEIEAKMQAEPISAAARVLTASKDPKAAAALFNYLPSIGSDPFLEEEVLDCVGRLTIASAKVDALLLNALKDPLPFRRTAAAYLIGRRGSTEYREQLRALLNDTDARVPRAVADGLFGKRANQMLAETHATDEALIKAQKMELTDTALLKFFRQRTLSEQDQKRFRALVRSLGNDAYVVRERATLNLKKEGVPVLAFLKEAEYDTNVERSRRARDLLEKIRLSNNTGVPIAGVHLLASGAGKKASSSEIIRALLAYAPFVDDETVEDELLTCLTLLSLREPAIEPELVKALRDISPSRRAAAAFVLGHVGGKDDIAKVQPLLDDVQPVVRLRAGQGLLAARDRAALPTFAKLMQSVPAPYLQQVEDVLNRIGGEKAPAEIAISSSDSREKAAKLWAKWIDANKDKIDLTALNDRESYLGLVTVCEYDNQVGNIQGQVWEGPRNGPKRWNFGAPNNVQLMGAMDAHTLPNGRVLVAENNQNRVTERSAKGEILWTYQTPNNPVCCQRLKNGNTFIASYNMIMEVKPDKSVVYQITQLVMPNNLQQNFYIFSAHKAKNGHVVMITAQGQIYELDVLKQGDARGKVVHNLTTQTFGNWCSVELMPNGNYLVASMNPGTVREIDRKTGAAVFTKEFNGAFRATRLPNGNILAASMNTRQVIEIERPSGNIRWQITCAGRPWGLHYR